MDRGAWRAFKSQGWCCESATLHMPANLENSAMATGLEKISFHSNPKERQCQRMFKLLHNCVHFICYEGDAQKSFKLGLNNIWTENSQVYQLGLEKAQEPEIKLPTSIGSQKKRENSRKIPASLTMLKSLTVWITTNCGKLFKRWEYQTTLLAS